MAERRRSFEEIDRERDKHDRTREVDPRAKGDRAEDELSSCSCTCCKRAKRRRSSITLVVSGGGCISLQSRKENQLSAIQGVVFFYQTFGAMREHVSYAISNVCSSKGTPKMLDIAWWIGLCYLTALDWKRVYLLLLSSTSRTNMSLKPP